MNPETVAGSAYLRSEKGMALVLTLMILVVLTAVVVEFSYGVFTTSAGLHNWKDSQRLSLVASSGISLALKTISDKEKLYDYTYPGKAEIPVSNILEGFSGTSVISVEDENAKMNINAIVWPNGTLNERAYQSFKRLLKELKLPELIADRVSDWIDRDKEPRMSGSEEGAKDDYMESVNELLLIKGIDNQMYEKLFPYITVYGLGRTDSDLVNINAASMPVILSLDERLTRDLAERIIDYREISPFEKTSDIVKVAGFEGTLGQALIGRIAVKTANFRIVSAAEENRIKRSIETVIEIKDGGAVIRCWQES